MYLLMTSLNSKLPVCVLKQNKPLLYENIIEFNLYKVQVISPKQSLSPDSSR